MSKKQPQFVEITDENQSKIQQFPRQISKSVVINTQIQAQASERQQKKKLAPKKKKQKVTKKKIIVLVIAIIGIIWMALFLDKGLPDDPSKIVKQVRIEGKFEFDQKIGKKFAWIKQKIDHFDDYSEQLFFQRLFIDYDEKMMKKNPTIILFIHQPSTVQTIQQSYTIQQYAKKKNAVLMCLQMRYFGESLPFGKKSFSTQNLKYLSISQMVEDVAFIINKLVQNEMFSITQNNIWIINGAKISGTIAVMVRSKYPQLTNGAIASSPLLPTVLAPLVGEKIYNKVGTGGKRCRVSLQKLKKDIQDQLSGDRKEGLIYQVGKGIQLSPQQILYIFISRINQIQKEAYLNICEGIEDNDQLYGLLKVALFTQEYFAFDPITYSSYELMMEEQWLFFDILREQRALWYLRCSQFGLFEVPPISKSYNPQAINETFFRNRCKKIFNANLWPNPQKTLKEQFRSLQTATNLLIIHGFYDVYYPYALKGKSKGTTTIEQKCIKCQSKFDYQKHLILSKQIQKVLNTQRQTLDKWIKAGKN